MRVSFFMSLLIGLFVLQACQSTPKKQPLLAPVKTPFQQTLSYWQKHTQIQTTQDHLKIITGSPLLIKDEPKSFYFLQSDQHQIFLYVNYGSLSPMSVISIENPFDQVLVFDVLKSYLLGGHYYTMYRLHLTPAQLNDLSKKNSPFVFASHQTSFSFTIPYLYSRAFLQSLFVLQLKPLTPSTQASS